MSGARILYLGAMGGTCLDRAHAYRRLGHDVVHIDPRQLLPASVWVDRLTWHVGGHLLSAWLKPRLMSRLRALPPFDYCHVDCGEWITPDLVKALRQFAACVVNYCIDDPTGPRDGRRFTAYRQSIPDYDLLIVMRDLNANEVQARGARNVLRVFMSADELSHAPRALGASDRQKWAADVLFLGSWMPERGPFLQALIAQGVPLTIRGANWHKAPEWAQLRAHWKGGPIGGADYAMAIQSAKVNLGLLSKGNRDRHTTRSMEIPALGGLLCAERTDEHEALYEAEREAIFWHSPEECANACMSLLQDEPYRARMAEAGRARLRRNGHMNEVVMSRIVDKVTHL